MLTIILDKETFFKLFFHWSGNVRRSFQYFFYFQLHRIFIDSDRAADTMTQSMIMRLEELGLSQAGGANDSSQKKKNPNKPEI